MTAQEVKDEFRANDGNPEIKAPRPARSAAK
jgi:flagellar biosynthesis protein FlhB